MIIVDASVAVKWFVPEPGSAEAEALIGADVPRAASEHLAVEVAQALLRHYRVGGVALTHVDKSLRTLRKVIRELPTPWLLDDAVQIAAACRCSVYDALYLAAADRLDCHVVSADAKLKRKVEGSSWAGRVLLLRTTMADQ